MGKSIVLYQSSHGNTEKILKEIAGQVTTEVDLVPIKNFKSDMLENCDRIAFGGSIHAGKIQKKVSTFAEKYGHQLTKKPLALFIGCLDREKYNDQIEASFPEDMKSHATAKICIGGDVVMSSLPLPMKMIMKKITPNEEDRHHKNEEGRKALVSFLQG